jgi:release factor glutamine methyltransferase
MRLQNDILARAALRLGPVASNRAIVEARLLLAHVLRVDVVSLIADDQRELSAEQVGRFNDFVARRARGEPVAYLLGYKDFLDHRFKVGPGVLIPRPETESLVQQIVAWICEQKRALRVLDLGCGSGCIGLSIANKIPSIELFLLDQSDAAIACAQENARSLQVKAQYVHQSWASAWPQNLPHDFDVIVSNPPYIPDIDWDDLAIDIRGFEPRAALTAGPEGLDAYTSILEHFWPRLRSGGLMAFEAYDADQRQKILTLLAPHKSHWEFEAHLFILKD